LEKARAVCGFAHGSLNVYDGEYFRTVAMHGYPEAFAELLRQPRRTGPQARFLEGDRIVHITDVAQGSGPDDPVYRAAIEAGVRTVLFVPLRNDRNLLGYLTANRREARPFSEKEIALLENFAAQAVIAMENARLIGELHERTDQVAELNRGLEARVAEQVEELSRVGRLKRFLAPQLAELIVSHGDEKILESHRRERSGHSPKRR
jgi:adenylate cyclase